MHYSHSGLHIESGIYYNHSRSNTSYVEEAVRLSSNFSPSRCLCAEASKLSQSANRYIRFSFVCISNPSFSCLSTTFWCLRSGVFFGRYDLSKAYHIPTHWGRQSVSGLDTFIVLCYLRELSMGGRAHHLLGGLGGLIFASIGRKTGSGCI